MVLTRMDGWSVQLTRSAWCAGEATSEALKLKIESAKQRREDLRDERLGTLVEKLVARHLCGAEDEDQEVAEGSGEKEETKEAPSKQGPIETETAVLQAFSAIDSEGKSSLGKKQASAPILAAPPRLTGLDLAHAVWPAGCPPPRRCARSAENSAFLFLGKRRGFRGPQHP